MRNTLPETLLGNCFAVVISFSFYVREFSHHTYSTWELLHFCLFVVVLGFFFSLVFLTSHSTFYVVQDVILQDVQKGQGFPKKRSDSAKSMVIM